MRVTMHTQRTLRVAMPVDYYEYTVQNLVFQIIYPSVNMFLLECTPAQLLQGTHMSQIAPAAEATNSQKFPEINAGKSFTGMVWSTPSPTKRIPGQLRDPQPHMPLLSEEGSVPVKNIEISKETKRKCMLTDICKPYPVIRWLIDRFSGLLLRSP